MGYAEHDNVFTAGEEARRMYFIKRGDLIYTGVDRSKLNPPPKPREWVGEAVLWTAWRHQGDLLSDSTSDLITVDPSQFVEHMCVHPPRGSSRNATPVSSSPALTTSPPPNSQTSCGTTESS